MSEIPSVYWMIIIGIIVVMFCLVLYYIAMLIRESRDVVRETKPLLKNADEILKQTTLIMADAQETVSAVKGTIGELNESVVQPLKKVGTIITIVGDFVSGFKK